ncbi:uncharacterized protein METZ01_LOCUS431885 [marine metagenome]|jgi:DNA-binding response OmpR family regulator|uniref:Response regulatory domain-containing protein n=1 Tax=marine metagenome TaxID=408172 RepID=A0A382Y879_9ZZZZ|tara:strand:- start:70 stop:459 length:390 start_codon:yes stop_codon:yes gene_type:complete
MKTSRILIIDQDDTFIRHVQSYFETLGVDVISAEEGTEGYRLAKTTDPGLIILDTVLPNLNGFQICRLLKDDDRYQEIPIVFVSSRDLFEDVTRAEQAKGDLFLRKPIVLDQLIDELITLISSYEPATA